MEDVFEIRPANLQFVVQQIREEVMVTIPPTLIVQRDDKQVGASELTQEQQDKVVALHTEYFTESVDRVQPLPGARDLLVALSEADVPWIIATSGQADEAESHLAKLDLPEEPPWISSAEVASAKPDPEILTAAAEQLGVDPPECIVVGDAVWDLLAARRAQMLGVGLMCGGYSQQELIEAHAFRVFMDPADLHASLDQIGVSLE